jgi:hypothetical protein
MDLGAANRKSFIGEGRVGFVAGEALSHPKEMVSQQLTKKGGTAN